MRCLISFLAMLVLSMAAEAQTRSMVGNPTLSKAAKVYAATPQKSAVIRDNRGQLFGSVSNVGTVRGNNGAYVGSISTGGVIRDANGKIVGSVR